MSAITQWIELKINRMIKRQLPSVVIASNKPLAMMIHRRCQLISTNDWNQMKRSIYSVIGDKCEFIDNRKVYLVNSKDMRKLNKEMIENTRRVDLLQSIDNVVAFEQGNWFMTNIVNQLKSIIVNIKNWIDHKIVEIMNDNVLMSMQMERELADNEQQQLIIHTTKNIRNLLSKPSLTKAKRDEILGMIVENVMNDRQHDDLVCINNSFIERILTNV